MSTTLHTKTAQDAQSARSTTALRIIVGISLLAACVMVLAETEASTAPDPVPTELSAEQLERAFWACDHAASTRGVDTGEGMACSVITDALKRQKFGGSFEGLLDWWRETKDAAYSALESTADNLAVADDFPNP